jgi:hypothetical protein
LAGARQRRPEVPAGRAVVRSSYSARSGKSDFFVRDTSLKRAAQTSLPTAGQTQSGYNQRPLSRHPSFTQKFSRSRNTAASLASLPERWVGCNPRTIPEAGEEGENLMFDRKADAGTKTSLITGSVLVVSSLAIVKLPEGHGEL